MKRYELNHKQAVLLRRRLKQKYLPKRLFISENEEDWFCAITGRIPLIFPYRMGDNAHFWPKTKENESKFLESIGIGPGTVFDILVPC